MKTDNDSVAEKIESLEARGLQNAQAVTEESHPELYAMVAEIQGQINAETGVPMRMPNVVVAEGGGKALHDSSTDSIILNPSKMKGLSVAEVKFSIAHEIAHRLPPDAGGNVPSALKQLMDGLKENCSNEQYEAIGDKIFEGKNTVSARILSLGNTAETIENNLKQNAISPECTNAAVEGIKGLAEASQKSEASRDDIATRAGYADGAISYFGEKAKEEAKLDSYTDDINKTLAELGEEPLLKSDEVLRAHPSGQDRVDAAQENKDAYAPVNILTDPLNLYGDDDNTVKVSNSLFESNADISKITLQADKAFDPIVPVDTPKADVDIATKDGVTNQVELEQQQQLQQQQLQKQQLQQQQQPTMPMNNQP